MRRALPAILLLLLVAAAPAQANMEVGMSDDLTIVHGYRDRALALRQFKAMGGTSVRINVEHRRNGRYANDVSASATRTPITQYDAAIDAVVAAGLKPQLTLIWRGRTNPGPIAAWMGNVVARYGDRVRRYSILNEPDLYLPVRGACTAAGRSRFRHRFPRRTFVYKGRPRAYDPTVPHGMNLRIACLREARGRMYGRIVRAARRSIRDALASAQVLAGETSGQAGLEWFVRAARPRSMHVTGWAHHPFQLRTLTPGLPAGNWGIGNLARVKRLVGMPLYLTEFGYPHPRSSMDRRVTGRRLSRRDVARALAQAWRIARRTGAREMLQYQWFVKPRWRSEYWETALLDKDNGTTTPAYRALRSLILGWRG